MEVQKSTEEKPDLKAEEENFFNQAAPTEKEKSKLTKDSILALYSQTPNANLVNQYNSVHSAPFQYGGGTFQSSFNNVPVQNGMQPQYNQFPVIGNQFPAQGFSQMPVAQQPFQSSFPQGSSQQAFGGAPVQQLPQQFSGMNLGQSFPAFAQPNTNVASNGSWQ